MKAGLPPCYRNRLHLLRFGCALVYSTALAPTGVAVAQADSARLPVPTVETAATTQRSVQPDVAILTLTFSARGRTPAAAGEALAARADSIRRAFQTLGIPRDSLITGSRWGWWHGPVERLVETHSVGKGSDRGGVREAAIVTDTSYRATDAIEVHFHDLKRVGAGIDSALAHGITEISPVRFQATDISVAQDDALREATVRARRQATAIAEASGGRLGRTLSLTTQRGEYPLFGPASLEAAGMSSQSGTEVIARSISVSVTVYGKWELIARP